MSQQAPELLDVLADKMGCNYLSDLHTADTRKNLPDLLRSFAAEDFPLSEWHSAIQYIAGIDAPVDDIQSPDEAKSFLLARI